MSQSVVCGRRLHRAGSARRGRGGRNVDCAEERPCASTPIGPTLCVLGSLPTRARGGSPVAGERLAPLPRALGETARDPTSELRPTELAERVVLRYLMICIERRYAYAGRWGDDLQMSLLLTETVRYECAEGTAKGVSRVSHARGLSLQRADDRRVAGPHGGNAAEGGHQADLTALLAHGDFGRAEPLHEAFGVVGGPPQPRVPVVPRRERPLLQCDEQDEADRQGDDPHRGAG